MKDKPRRCRYRKIEHRNLFHELILTFNYHGRGVANGPVYL
ncbi:Uncharacterised protein [Legionella donaldsonii]|uniref:Uncharacterized protein n=1 Tax=Legionella donaldsonii TaxID=45060 RepID=A0A378J2J2_9GAMM|nr:Uncharacterised protein [Legionella donaldsonii]